MSDELVFNPPPGWPTPPPGWKPPHGWSPDPSWPAAPDGWALWISQEGGPKSESGPDPASDPSVKAPTAEAESEGEDESTRDRHPHSDSPAGLDGAPRDELTRLQAAIAQVRQELADLNDERVLQEVGIYRYHHPLEHADAYRDRLRELDGRLTEMVKAGDAIHASTLFTYNNSLAQGRKMTRDFGKLMLRAYNAEAENCVRSLRAGNVQTAKQRLETASTQIARLGLMMEMRISDSYHGLRIEEIELTAD